MEKNQKYNETIVNQLSDLKQLMEKKTMLNAFVKASEMAKDETIKDELMKKIVDLTKSF